jgi:cell division protein FtsB
MDIRITALSRARALALSADRLRRIAQHAPQAEALAEGWIRRARPFLDRAYGLRRRAATIGVGSLALLLFVHVMFGANGMIAYRQKKAEYESLRKRILLEQTENERYTKQIQDLKSDQKAIEKEAREQLHYARPGEYVYVPPAPADTLPPANHSAKH